MFAQNSKSYVLLKTESEKADGNSFVFCLTQKRIATFLKCEGKLLIHENHDSRVTGNFLRKIRTDVD